MEQNNQVYEAVEIDAVDEIVDCNEPGISGKDLAKGGLVLGGTILVWELGKGLVKKGYNKFVKPTKAGEFLSTKKANVVQAINDKKAARAAAKEAKKVTE